MKYSIGLIIIAFLCIIYNILLIFDKTYEYKIENNKNVKLKKWEKITTFCVMTIILGIIVIIAITHNQILYIYSFIYYIIIFLLYLSNLINILLKRDDKKITKRELNYLTTIPLIFTVLYNTQISQEFISIIKRIYGTSIIYFIIVQNIKCFIITFFITLNVFLIMIELKELVNIKRKVKKKNIEFEEDEFIYRNARGKTGIEFFKNYIKDILILIRLKMYLIIQNLYINIFKFIFKVFIKILKNLTNNFSIYVIIMKTFNISIITSLLVTYYKLLNGYHDDIVTEFYSVIITAIIIPIILNTISELKESLKK